MNAPIGLRAGRNFLKSGPASDFSLLPASVGQGPPDRVNPTFRKARHDAWLVVKPLTSQRHPIPALDASPDATRSEPLPGTTAKRAALDRRHLDRAREGLRVIEDWCVSAAIAGILGGAQQGHAPSGWVAATAQLQNRSRQQRQGDGAPALAMLSPPSRSARPQSRWWPPMRPGAGALRVLQEFGRSSEPRAGPPRPSLRYCPLTTWRRILGPALGSGEQRAATRKRAAVSDHRIQRMRRCGSSNHGWAAALECGVVWCSTAPGRGEDKQRLIEARGPGASSAPALAALFIRQRPDRSGPGRGGRWGSHLGQGPAPAIRRRSARPRPPDRAQHQRLEQLQAAVAPTAAITSGVGPVLPTPTKRDVSGGLPNCAPGGGAVRFLSFEIGGIDASNRERGGLQGAGRWPLVRAVMGGRGSWPALPPAAGDPAGRKLMSTEPT